MSSTTESAYAGESKADAWLFEHSKFLRKHFSPQGPTEIPSKHSMIQDRSSGDAFPGETKMDAALFEHSKFLRKHVKHEENVDGGVKSKSAMLRESLDGGRTHGGESITEDREALDQTGTNSNFHDDLNGAALSRQITRDPAAVNDVEDRNGVNELPAQEIPHTPAWQVATDNERSYGDEVSLRSAAKAGPGLIEAHPTTMESTSSVGRPVPHSLMSNSAAGWSCDETRSEEPWKQLSHEDSVAG